jgi:hypothetical protein
MLVIDGPPGGTGPRARYPAGPLLFPRLTSGAAVFLDDAQRKDERETVSQWFREYPDLCCDRLPLERGCAVLRKAGS